VICRGVPSSQGAIRLVRVAGIDVFLHWSWFVVALFEVTERTTRYRSAAWNVAEYLALFGIVTLHEFGHALACRQVGGRADTIVLWPLGGVAYVDPPPRPGATLWSIAAGPLVNVALLFPLLPWIGVGFGSPGARPADPVAFLGALALINVVLLVFNLLPVYPLDGGQVLRSLLWFVLGRARSLTVASGIGFLGVLALLALALATGSVWFGILAVFVGLSCWRGFQQARALARLARLPRRAGTSCPSCGTAPPLGTFWACGRCGARFDTFETGATCPACGATFAATRCLDCGRSTPLGEWLRARAIA
jgi:Zn-dependent protease